MTHPPSYHYAYPPSSPPPPPGPRPQSVTFAAMLSLLTVISNVGVGYTIVFDVLRRSKGESEDLIGVILLGGSLVVLGLVIVLVSLGLLRGGGAARVLAYIISSLSLCSCGLLEIGLVASTIEDGVEAPEQLMAAILGFLNVLAYITVMVLLSLPTTARWFRAHRDARAYTSR